MNYVINPLPNPAMLYDNVAYWNPGYEILDTLIEFKHAPKRPINLRYHPKVPVNVLWIGHYQRLYANLKVGQHVSFSFAGPVPILESVHFGYRQFFKDEGKDTPIASQELRDYLYTYDSLNNTYVENGQGLLIYVPTLSEKRIVLIAKSVYPKAGLIRYGTTRITFETYDSQPLTQPVTHPLSQPTVLEDSDPVG